MLASSTNAVTLFYKGEGPLNVHHEEATTCYHIIHFCVLIFIHYDFGIITTN